MKRVLAIIGILVVAGLALILPVEKAFALADPLSKVQVVQKTCSETASKIVSSGVDGQAFKFSNEGTAQDGVGDNEVFLGGSDVNVTTKGWRYEAGEGDSWDVNPGAVYCATNTGETTVLTILIGRKGP